LKSCGDTTVRVIPKPRQNERCDVNIILSKPLILPVGLVGETIMFFLIFPHMATTISLTYLSTRQIASFPRTKSRFGNNPKASNPILNDFCS
jgi:hypothetical protein